MDTLKRRLHQSVYPLFIEELWGMVITLLQEKVGTGVSPINFILSFQIIANPLSFINSIIKLHVYKIILKKIIAFFVKLVLI